MSVATGFGVSNCNSTHLSHFVVLLETSVTMAGDPKQKFPYYMINTGTWARSWDLGLLVRTSVRSPGAAKGSITSIYETTSMQTLDKISGAFFPCH